MRWAYLIQCCIAKSEDQVTSIWDFALPSVQLAGMSQA